MLISRVSALLLLPLVSSLINALYREKKCSLFVHAMSFVLAKISVIAGWLHKCMFFVCVVADFPENYSYELCHVRGVVVY